MWIDEGNAAKTAPPDHKDPSFSPLRAQPRHWVEAGVDGFRFEA